MYLKEIRAHGFKSFADKTIIELDTGITGVVGPNGSGKSNVVDAVRWVLGEQSVKSLRGDGNMTDVIFSGSKSRKSQNIASVSLVFDNTDNYLPLAFAEVAIKRRVYKDGSNEYFINNERCRLKDVVSLLLDSGMAKESFNIISQGKIDEILLSKPVDRRTIFEEAAGVLKYKRRKEDALRKLDRTHDNLSRVNDIINELEERVMPLKKQKEKALKYQNIYENLRNIDLSLLVHDIKNISEKYTENKKQIETLNNEILKFNSNNNKGEAKILDYKTKISKLEERVNLKQKELLEITKNVEKISARKQIVLERKKYEVEDSKLHSALITLKEEEAKLKNQIENNNLEIYNLNKDLAFEKEKLEKSEEKLQKIKNDKNDLEYDLSKLLRLNENIKSKIEALKDVIYNGSSLPYAVKAVLENVKLSGVHDVLGNLIEVDEKYATAISTSLGMTTTNIVVDNEKIAKEAINFLKEKRFGRATFLPLNIIKSSFVNSDYLSIAKKEEGFIDIASNLVKFDSKYRNIIENKLGNVLIIENIDYANKISKLLNHRVKLVTLDGELISAGGSITGGKTKTRNMINDKHDLENYIKESKNVIDKIKETENKINEVDELLRNLDDKYYLINKNYIKVKETINSKLINNKILIEDLSRKENEIKGTGHVINNSVDKEEQEIIEKFYQTENDKNKVTSELNSYLKEKKNLEDELSIYELEIKKENSLWNQKNKELSKLEIEVNRADVKLDNLLNYISENYNMTYENAALKYILEIDEEIARTKLTELKKELREIGPVNLESIEEYDKVSERYEFLIKQKEDLIGAENTLLEIIGEMDEVMIKEFEKTFKLISKNFEETFKELFKGGTAKLRLTDPDNLLETGVEIEASPPGKSLKSITLLSGGEKTFTAISLLFAILKTRPVPFCILDEVEAALDEANVEAFGNYLSNFKKDTQFILITHKKKTMEFADVLYGITMQESGVSKLVSVRLDEIDK
jgi:Chromosome segregation ATPases